MKKHFNFLFTITILLGVFSGIEAQERSSKRWIVQTSDPSSIVALGKQEDGWTTHRLSEDLNIFRIKYQGDASSEEIKNTLNRIENMRSTTSIYKDQAVMLRNTDPNDPFFLQQWNMEIISMPRAWDITTGGVTITGDTIVVAVLDDGFDLSHLDIIDNIWFNHAEIPSDEVDNDENGYVDDFAGVYLQSGRDDHPVDEHGLNVCGIIGAKGNNDRAISGVNWNVKMMLISGIDFESDIIEGYEYIAKMREKYNATDGQEGAFIVASNLSAGIDLAFAEDHPLWCQVYENLGQAGILNVAATTNKDIDVDVEGDMPTTCTSNYLISVTNMNQDDEKVTNAGYGLTHIDLGAPGTSTLTTHLGNSTRNFPGTSAAAPHVSGVVALMYAAACEGFIEKVRSDPATATLDIRSMILDNVDNNQSIAGITASGGRLNAFNAILGLAEVCGGSTGDLDILGLWPNPTKDGRIIVQYQAPDNEAIDFRVIDVLGRIIYEEQIEDPLFSVKQIRYETSALPVGIYFATIQKGDEIKAMKFFAR